jgi:hypothetical protein
LRLSGIAAILVLVRLKFARSARRHKIGKAHALAALAEAGEPTVSQGMYEGIMRTYLDWVGTDDRGVELEITGRIAEEDEGLVIVIHVMPTEFRSKK